MHVKGSRNAAVGKLRNVTITGNRFNAPVTLGTDLGAGIVVENNYFEPVDGSFPYVSISSAADHFSYRVAKNVFVNASSGETANYSIKTGATLADSGSVTENMTYLRDCDNTSKQVALGNSANVSQSGNASKSCSVLPLVPSVGPPPDTRAPTVSIVSPATATTVSGSAVPLIAGAWDGSAITKVLIYVDSRLIKDDRSAPFSASWDSKSVANGSHTILVKAYDSHGNSASSSRVVTVKNP